MSWERLNKWLERFKKFPLFKLLYKIPGAPALYHFSLALFGAVLYGFPSGHIFVIGVTGTKGKTTTLEILNSILEAAGKKTALLSTLRVKIADKSEKNKFGNSMPGRFFVQGFLESAAKEKCQYALIEVTSQGVVLSRHRFIDWNVGVFTNLAPEHIEAHGSFERYRKAKLDFLRYVGARGGKIFINKEDRNADFFFLNLKNFGPLSYSRNEEEILRLLPRRSPLRIAVDNSRPEFPQSDFNKDNMAAALAVAAELGISEKFVMDALHGFRGVAGRMEFVQKKPFAVVVDYAHTPDSLKVVYKFLSSEVRQSRDKAHKLICVLGAAGGGRDKWKRPEMGKIAAEYCDEIILTNEDPYDENPEDILMQIEEGMHAGRRWSVSSPPASPKLQRGECRSAVHKIVDRREAVKKAVSLAKNGDIVILTGKGSEDWMHLARGKKIPWDERAVIKEVLKNRKLGSTPSRGISNA